MPILCLTRARRDRTWMISQISMETHAHPKKNQTPHSQTTTKQKKENSNRNKTNKACNMMTDLLAGWLVVWLWGAPSNPKVINLICIQLPPLQAIKNRRAWEALGLPRFVIDKCYKERDFGDLSYESFSTRNRVIRVGVKFAGNLWREVPFTMLWRIYHLLCSHSN